MRLIIFLLLVTQNLYAKCMMNYISVAPANDETIAVNQHFLVNINGYEFLSRLDWNQDASYNSQFVRFSLIGTEQNRESVEIKKMYHSSFGTNFFWLKPQGELKLDETYTLNIETYDQIKKQWAQLKLQNPPIITPNTSAIDDKREKIKLTEDPKFLKTQYQMFGCGPERFAEFSWSIPSGSIILAEVTNTKTQVKAENFIIPKGSNFSVGHGMCGGSFNLEDELEYSVRFKLINFSGIESDYTKSYLFKINPKASGNFK